MRYSDLAVERGVARGRAGRLRRRRGRPEADPGPADRQRGRPGRCRGIAAVRRWVDFAAGDRSAATFLRRYAPLPEAEWYRSGHYAAYAWLLRDRHVVGQGGAVNWNEGRHSRLRDKLKRLQRRARGYSKSLRMLRDSLSLVCRRLELFNTNKHRKYPKKLQVALDTRRAYTRALKLEARFRNVARMHIIYRIFPSLMELSLAVPGVGMRRTTRGNCSRGKSDIDISIQAIERGGRCRFLPDRAPAI